MEPGTQGIYTMPDSKITSLDRLKGKTVAINAPKNSRTCRPRDWPGTGWTPGR